METGQYICSMNLLLIDLYGILNACYLAFQNIYSLILLLNFSTWKIQWSITNLFRYASNWIIATSISNQLNQDAYCGMSGLTSFCVENNVCVCFQVKIKSLKYHNDICTVSFEFMKFEVMRNDTHGLKPLKNRERETNSV